MKLLRCVFLLLGLVQFGFSQNAYKFDYQYFYYDDGLVFMDTIGKKEFTLGEDGQISSTYLDGTSSKKKYCRTQLENTSPKNLRKSIEQKALTLVDNYTYQLQKINGDWLYLEIDIDDEDLDFEPVKVRTCKINDVEILIMERLDWGEAIFILNYNKNAIGISEDGEFQLSDKVEIVSSDRDAIEGELEVRYPKYRKQTGENEIAYFTFVEGRVRLVDVQKETSVLFKTHGGVHDSYVGISATAEKYDSSKLYLIKDSVDIEDLEKLHGKLFRDNSSLDKKVFYVHVKKNIFAKIIRNKESFYAVEYETLVSHKVSINKSVFTGKNIIITKDGNEVIIKNETGRLQPESDKNTHSSVKESKLSLYGMNIVRIREQGKYYLYDRTRQNKIFETGYDSIYMNDRYIVVFDGKQKSLYNSQLRKMDMSKAKHWDLFSFSPELIERTTNKAMHMHYDNSISTKPESTDIAICDVVGGPFFYDNIGSDVKSKFIQNGYTVTERYDSNLKIELLDTTLWSSYSYIFDADSVANLIKLEDISSNDYLEELSLVYGEKDFVPDSPIIYYKNDRKGLAKEGTNNHKKMTKEFSSFFEYNSDVIFTYHNTTHPIKFTDGGLHGYVEINQKPFAKELGLFNGGYARYTLPSGKSGWLSKHGDMIAD